MPSVIGSPFTNVVTTSASSTDPHAYSCTYRIVSLTETVVLYACVKIELLIAPDCIPFSAFSQSAKEIPCAF